KDIIHVFYLAGEHFELLGIPIIGGVGSGAWQIQNEMRDDVFYGTPLDEDAVESNGEGDLFDTILQGVMEGTFNKIILIGHSHGGGSIYDLSHRIAQHPVLQDGGVEIVMTAYIDAIEQSGAAAEVRIPVGTQYHVNIYQSVGPH